MSLSKLGEISKCSEVFFDAVINPFGAELPAQVPDAYHHLTMCLIDWIDLMSVSLSIPSGGSPAGGVAFMFVAGGNDLTEVSTLAAQTYGIVVMPLNEDGGIMTNSGGTQITMLVPTNYQVINGTGNGQSMVNALVDSFRIFSTGIRLWPTIEIITDSETRAVASYYAGLITPNTVRKAFNDESNFYDVMRQSYYVEMYQNSQGCTVRMDPFDEKRFLDMKTLYNWSNMTSFDTSNIAFPIVAAQFTSADYEDGSVLPVRFMSQHWLEGQLVQPTPLLPTPSCNDLNFWTLAQTITDNPKDFPIVVEGHSFPSIVTKTKKFLPLIDKALKDSSLYRTVRPAILGVTESIGKIARRNRRRRRRQRTAKLRIQQSARQPAGPLSVAAKVRKGSAQGPY
jgi:hypothetical protein